MAAVSAMSSTSAHQSVGSAAGSGKHRRRRRRRSSQPEDRASVVPAVPNHPLETVVEILLAALLAFAPLAIGSAEPWSQLIVYCLVALLALAYCLRLLLAKDLRLIRTWAYLPIVLFLLLVVLQLVPLPSKVAALISPQTTAQKAQLLGDLPGADQILSRSTLSFYPAATRRDLYVVLAAAVVFLVVVNNYRRLEQIRRLLITVVVIGAAVALLALVQDITGATHIYWKVTGRGVANAGPFVAYSHYGQFMNLSVGAGIGLLLVELHKIFQGAGLPGSTVSRPLLDRKHRVAWILGAFILLGLVTVLLSGSRGAMIGLLVALGMLTATLSGTRGLDGNAWFIVPLSVLACAIVLFFGPGVVFDRVSSLEKSENYADRWQIVKDLTDEWKQFPIVGTGLGTHEVIYPRYDHSSRLDTATHAENEYAQVMEETGAVGVLLLLVFAIIIWHHYTRAARNADPPIRLASIGLGMGLIAIQVHSLSDFGQHLPANACLTAVFCGLLISLSRLRQFQREQLKAMGGGEHAEMEGNHHHHSSAHGSTYADGESLTLSDESRRASSETSGEPSNEALEASSERLAEPLPKPASAGWRWARRSALLAGVAMICLWQVSGAWNAWRADSTWDRVYGLEKYLVSNDWDTPDETDNHTYRQILGEAALACSFAPDDVRYRYSLNSYRWHAISRVRNPGTDEIYYDARHVGYARQICKDLEQTRLLCPTYSHALLLQGEIEFAFLHDPAGPGHIRTALRLARCDQTAAGQTARCDAAEGKWDDSVKHFRRFVQLGGNFGDVLKVYIDQYQRPDLAYQVAHGNVEKLKDVANAVVPIPGTTHPPSVGRQGDPVLEAKARNEAFETLKVQATRPDAPGNLLVELAELYVARNNYPSAITIYRRAVAIDYANVSWHLALAECLKHEGEFSEAIREARAHQGATPSPQVQQFIREVEVALAEQSVARDSYPEAIAAYRRALANDYSDIPWQLALARCLAHEGSFSEAIREAGAHQGSNPSPETRKLIQELENQEAAIEKAKLAAAATNPTTAPSDSAAPTTEPAIDIPGIK